MLYPSVLITEPKRNENPKCEYLVTIDISHGDDSVNISEKCAFRESSIKEMLEFLTFLYYTKEYLSYNGNEFKDCFVHLCKVLNATGKDADNIHDNLISYPGYDKVYEGSNYLAYIIDFEVVYFDKNGTLFSCDIHWNDNSK